MNNAIPEIQLEAVQWLRHAPLGVSMVDLPLECLTDKRARLAWGIILDLHHEGVCPTAALLRARHVDASIIASTKRSRPGIPIQKYAEVLRDRYASILLDGTLTEIKDGLKNGTSAEKGMQAMAEVIPKISRYTASKNQGENLTTSQERYWARLSGRKPAKSNVRLHFPFPALKRRMPAMSGGTMWALAAFSTYGKTVWMEQCAEHWAEMGYNGIYFNCELQPHDMRRRRMMRFSGVSIIDQDREEEKPGQILTKDQRQSLDQAEAIIASWPGDIIYLDCDGYTMSQIITVTHSMMQRRPWKNKDPLGFLLLDYFGLVRREGGDTSQTAIDNDVQRYKSLCIQCDIVGGMADQFDKQTTNKKFPNLTDIRFAGAPIYHKCNIGQVIDRDVEGGEILDSGSVRVTKSTSGIRAPIPIVFNGSRLRFEAI